MIARSVGLYRANAEGVSRLFAVPSKPSNLDNGDGCICQMLRSFRRLPKVSTGFGQGLLIIAAKRVQSRLH